MPKTIAGKLASTLLIGSLLLPAGAGAADDCDFFSEDFFKNATTQNIKHCIQNGQDIDSRNTPLHLAAEYSSQPAVIEALIKADAGISSRNGDGEAVLILNRLLAFFGYIRNTDNRRTPLHWAAGYNPDPAVIDALVKAGADIDSKAAMKLTPLHWAAAFNSQPAVINALIKAGADINSEAIIDLTPLHWAAAFNSQPAMIDALIEAGADINSQDYIIDSTPLHWAAVLNPEPAIIDALIKAGADINSQDSLSDSTPLHWAAVGNPEPSIIDALIKAGADIDSRDDDGWTPLHGAAAFNSEPAVIDALLKAGANPKLANNDGKTAWDLIQKNQFLNDTDAYTKLESLHLL